MHGEDLGAGEERPPREVYQHIDLEICYLGCDLAYRHLGACEEWAEVHVFLVNLN